MCIVLRSDFTATWVACFIFSVLVLTLFKILTLFFRIAGNFIPDREVVCTTNLVNKTHVATADCLQILKSKCLHGMLVGQTGAHFARPRSSRRVNINKAT